MKNRSEQARSTSPNECGPSCAVRKLIAELRESGVAIGSTEIIGLYAVDRYLQNLLTEMAEHEVSRAITEGEREIFNNRRRR